MITGKLYDWLRWLALVVLPALGTFYLTLGTMWDLPSPQEVAGTILALCTFIGAVLQISNNNFKKNHVEAGDFVVFEGEEGKTFSMDLGVPPEELVDAKAISFKVAKKKPSRVASRRVGRGD